MFGRTLAKYKELETLFKLYLKILQNKKEWSASFYLYIFFQPNLFYFYGGIENLNIDVWAKL